MKGNFYTINADKVSGCRSILAILLFHECKVLPNNAARPWRVDRGSDAGVVTLAGRHRDGNGRGLSHGWSFRLHPLLDGCVELSVVDEWQLVADRRWCFGGSHSDDD